MSAAESYLRSPMRSFDPDLGGSSTKKKKSPSTSFQSDELFRREVPIRVVSDQREDRVADLLVRVAFDPLDGGEERKGGGHASDRVYSGTRGEKLSVRVTDESDAFFLYHLDLTEEDYKHLRQEQDLLVDFATFPKKLVELLQACAESAEQERPDFVATLFTSGKPSPCLRIYKTDTFKNLCHVELKLVPGDDDAIKHYLAATVAELKALASELQNENECLQSDLGVSEEERKKTADAHAELHASYQSDTHQLKMEYAEELAAAKEKALKVEEELRASMREEMEKAIAERDEKIAVLEEAQRVLKESLGEARNELELTKERLGESQTRLKSSQGEAERERKEVELLRHENRELDKKLHEVEKEVRGEEVKVAALRQQVQDKEDALARTSEHLKAVEKQKEHLDDALRAQRQSGTKVDEQLQASIEEIKKGNSIIEKLQNELRSTRTKLKLKVGVVQQQEKLLEERLNALGEREKEAAHLRKEMESMAEAVKMEKARKEEAERKLEEALSNVRSNEQVISYLNKEISNTQLRGRGGVTRQSYTSKYAVQSTSPPPPADTSYRYLHSEGHSAADNGKDDDMHGATSPLSRQPLRFQPTGWTPVQQQAK